jgi:hypothetical protein
MTGDTVLAAVLLDARERIALVMMSEDAVGISVSRYDDMPEEETFKRELAQRVWVVVFREAGEEVFISSTDPEAREEDKPFKLNSPQERESVQFAVEVALGAWPEWCPHLRESIRPRSVIVLPRLCPEA